MLTEPAWPCTQRTGGDFAFVQDVPAQGNDIFCFFLRSMFTLRSVLDHNIFC